MSRRISSRASCFPHETQETCPRHCRGVGVAFAFFVPIVPSTFTTDSTMPCALEGGLFCPLGTPTSQNPSGNGYVSLMVVIKLLRLGHGNCLLARLRRRALVHRLVIGLAQNNLPQTMDRASNASEVTDCSTGGEVILPPAGAKLRMSFWGWWGICVLNNQTQVP